MIECTHKEIEEQPFTCEHYSCFTRFKTKRQKILHHNKLEKECMSEKNILIKLLGKMKSTLSLVISKYPKRELEELKTYQEIKMVYNDIIKNKIMDPEFLFSIMGEKF